MKYYRIVQDINIEDIPVIKDITTNPIERMKLEEKANILYVQNTDKEVEYIDYIDRPLLLVSDKMKDILKTYNKKLDFKATTLTNMAKQSQEVYWFFEPPIVECLGEKTEYLKDNSIKTPVIDISKTEDLSFFQLKNGIQRINVIRLDLAESILRRRLYGFSLIGIETE